MSDRSGSFPPDEPVIGGSAPASLPPSRGAAVGYQPAVGEPEYYEEDGAEWDGDSYDEPYDDEYGYEDDEYYDDGYYVDDEVPTRQPLFYLFVVAAVLVGAAVLFLLFSLVRSNDDDADVPTVVAAFKVSLDSPRTGDRVEIGKETQVTVSATASEQITKFELFVDDKAVDQVDATPPATGDVYHATMKTTFDKKGEHELFVRVSSVSGASKDTDKVKVVAVEDIGDRPVRIKGKVLASVTMRTGPGNDFEGSGTLNPGRDIDVVGKTRDGEWLLVDVGGGNWVPRTAIELLDSIDLVPVREPSPTPQPTATSTPEPSPTASPTPDDALPDFAPTNAILIDGGRALRVTVVNQSTNNFSGTLVVSATGVGASPPSKAFALDLPANSSVTIDFDLDPPVTEQQTVHVKVDPDNAVKESTEDNNSANFVLQPPVEQPSLAIQQPTVSAGSITVVVQNNGGELPSSNMYVQVKLDATGETVQSAARSVALAKNQTAEFTMSRPQGSGSATVTVLVNGQPLASTTISLSE